MTCFLLIRHCATDFLDSGQIAGRLPDIRLSSNGRSQAEQLAGDLENVFIAAVYSSPLERCLETARYISDRRGLEIDTRAAFGELHFGKWTGKSFSELETDSIWSRFNRARSVTRIPDGELMLEAQARMVTEIEQLTGEHVGETVAIVSHADPIRAAVCYYAGIPLDFYHRFEILPASVSVLGRHGEDVKILAVNHGGSAYADGYLYKEKYDELDNRSDSAKGKRTRKMVS